MENTCWACKDVQVFISIWGEKTVQKEAIVSGWTFILAGIAHSQDKEILKR